MACATLTSSMSPFSSGTMVWTYRFRRPLNMPLTSLPYDGTGIGVAVVDSGIKKDAEDIKGHRG